MKPRLRPMVVLVALACVGATVGPRVALLPNGGLDSSAAGWRNDALGIRDVESGWVSHDGRGGGGALHLASHRADDDRKWLMWSSTLDQIPVGRRLRFGGWVRGRACKAAPQICVRVLGPRGSLGPFGTTYGPSSPSGDFDWTRIESSVGVPDSAREIRLVAYLVGPGEVWFDDLEVADHGALSEEERHSAFRDTVPAAGPGTYLVRGQYEITRRAGAAGPDRTGLTLMLPMPLDYREQTPLSYELTVDPPDLALGMLTREDHPGNWVAEVALKPFGTGQPVRLAWSALVLVAPRSFDDVPARAMIPTTCPAEARPWLASTRCVEAADSRIERVAREIRGESRDVPEIIRSTLARLRDIYAHQSGRCTTLDAVEALERQGSCTSCANLAAALLRANGIPARILSGYPTWGGPMQTHYIVEAWIPEYGWYPIESTMLRAPWDPYQQINVSIVPTEYEDERSRLRPGAAGGVPYLSLTESSGDVQGYQVLGTLWREMSGDHMARLVRRFAGTTPSADWKRAVAAARKRWELWITGNPKSGEPGRLATRTSVETFVRADSPAAVSSALGAGPRDPAHPRHARAAAR